jgi:hypothetical protein
MLSTMAAWAAAHSDFLAAAGLAAIGMVLCAIVFPQDGGGDFEFFGGDSGGE